MTDLTRRRAHPSVRLASLLGSLLLLLAACRLGTPTPSKYGTPPVPAPAEIITTGNIGRLTELARWPVAGLVNHTLDFSPDGRRLALAFDEGVDADTAIQLWDVASGQPTASLTGLHGRIFSLAFSPDGQMLAAGSSNKTVKLWQVSSGQDAQLFTLPADADSLAFSPAGDVLAVGLHDGTIQLLAPGSGQVLRSLAGQADLVSSVAFSPDGTQLATASFDHSLKLWDVASGRSIQTLSGHQSAVNRVAYAPDGKTLASASSDGTVRVWDLATGQARLVLSVSQPAVLEWFDVDFSPDGTLLAASSDYQLSLWDTTSGRALRTLDRLAGGPVGFDTVDTSAFSRDGKLLATGGDRIVRLWGVP